MLENQGTFLCWVDTPLVVPVALAGCAARCTACNPRMAILITGACGFVALNVVEHLLEARRDFAALPGRFTLIGGSIRWIPIDRELVAELDESASSRRWHDPDANRACCLTCAQEARC